LLDQGIHMVDLLRLFGGEYTNIYSFISNDFWNYDVEDNAYSMMQTDSGVTAMLHSSATSWRHSFHLEMTLAKGSIVLRGILSGSKSYGAETMTVIYANPDDDNGDPREQMTRYNNDPSWDNEIKEFARCILDDKPITCGSSEDALRTMELVYKIYCADPVWREKYDLNVC
jgi:predicted dehydrogenase